MNINDLHLPLAKLLPYKLNGNAMIVYGVILHHAYKRACYCKNSTLAAETGCSVRTIQNAIKELDEKKCIKLEYKDLDGFQCRYITPLILFDVVLTPENFKRDKNEFDVNGGFEEL